MLMNTQDGATYTLREYTDWLRQAGFSKGRNRGHRVSFTGGSGLPRKLNQPNRP